MVVVNTILNTIKSAALDEFDVSSHIGVGDDNTPASPTDTALGNEIIRKAFDETPIKLTGPGTYDFSALVGLTEANGNTFREVGLFDAAAAGNIQLRNILPTEVAKTLDKEVSVGLRVTITVTNI